MSTVFQKGAREIAQQNLDVEGSADIVLIPMSESYTPDAEAHEFISDVVADELDADGYDSGFGGADRQTPSSRSWDRNDSASPSRLELQFDDVTWSDLGGGVSTNNDVMHGVVIAEERTDDTDSPLLGFDTLADDRATNGADITYSTDADGMIQLVTNP
jgi:hypothetical protein